MRQYKQHRNDAQQGNNDKDNMEQRIGAKADAVKFIQARLRLVDFLLSPFRLLRSSRFPGRFCEPRRLRPEL